MGIRFLDTFRKRYYNREKRLTSKLGCESLEYGFLNKRSKELNKSKFSSEEWFMPFLNSLEHSETINIKQNFPVLNRFFADFFLFDFNIVIEIDGSSHKGKKEYDTKRDDLFKKRGLKVFRIKNGDTYQANLVIDKINDLIKNRTQKEKTIFSAKPKNNSRKKIKTVSKKQFHYFNAIQDQMKNKILKEMKNKMINN